MSPQAEKLMELAERIRYGEEFGLQEVEDALRVAAISIDRCYFMLNLMNDLLRQEEEERKKGKDDDTT